MGDQLRDRLHEEMAATVRPPVDGLVPAAVARATSIRRRRRLVSRAGTTAVVGAVVGVVALGGHLIPTHDSSITGVAGAAPTTVAPAAPAQVTKAAPATPSLQAAPATPSLNAAAASVPVTTTTPDPQALVKAQLAKLEADKPGSTSAGVDKEKLAAIGQYGAVTTPAALPSGVPATPTGMLELLTSLLPAGSTSHPGVADDGSNGIEIYVATPTGPAMVRVGLARTDNVPLGCDGHAGCTVDTAGDIVTVGSVADNCLGTKYVSVIHPDGSSVVVSLSTCLEWDGTRNASSPLAMTAAQAITVAEDPRWDVSMDPALVSAGAAQFPSPHPFG